MIHNMRDSPTTSALLKYSPLSIYVIIRVLAQVSGKAAGKTAQVLGLALTWETQLQP